MMSITPIKSASGAAKYYLDEEKRSELPDLELDKSGENYYLREKSQDENTFWFGQLAIETGLDGKPIDKETLENALSGNLRNEEVHGKREKHKSGFDLTFSAPKSVSFLALVGGDTRLIEAHTNAIKFTLSELEKDAAQAKVTHEKGIQSFENTESMLFGVVRHKTSRENDPQLHSHVLTPNMTRDNEGNLRALASCLKQKGGVINGTSERIYNFQKYYTALYQSQLAKTAEELGYSIRGIGNGQFEIKDVPTEIIDEFSQRKQQINQKTMDLGYNTQATRDLAAKNTRKDKSYLSDATLNNQWQKRTNATGFDAKSFVINSIESPKEPIRSEITSLTTQESITRALNHLSQYNTSIGLEKLIEVAASDFTKGGQANALDIKKELDQWIKNGHLIPLNEEGQFTTKSMLENEKLLMEITKGRASHMRTRPDDNVLAKLNISDNSQRKIKDIFESTKQFQVVNVYGTSQQIAETLLNVGNHSSKRVHLISQNTAENQQNKQDITRQSFTLANWIKQVFTEDKRHSLHQYLHSTDSFTNKDILIVDNAGKMSANELIDITTKAKESQSKVIFLNRTSSRQGFKSHSAIDLYSKGNVATHDWVNNKQSDAKVFLHDHEHQKIANIYAEITDKDNTQIVTTSGVEQKKLTETIRDTLKNEGQLTYSSVSIDTQLPHYLSKSQKEIVKHYQPGMTLRHWQDKKPSDYIITKVDQASNTLYALDKQTGDTIDFDPSSSSFKSLNMQIYKPDRIEVSTGERLQSKTNHRASGFKQGETFTVSQISSNSLTIITRNGETKNVSFNDLRDAPLQYNYVHSSQQLEQKQHTILSGKSFSLSKELLNDLAEKSQRIDIFTDNTDKALKTMESSEFRPSAVERVLHSQMHNDRYLSNSTAQTLKSDVQEALNILSAKQNTNIIEKAVSFALAHVSEREAGFTQKELVLEAIRYSFEEAGQAISKEHIEKELMGRSDTLSAEFSDGTRWTTQQALDTENHILSNIKQGIDKHSPFATVKQVSEFLTSKTQMTTGQKDALQLISTTKDSFVAIQGLAGVGKSTMLESNIELIQSVKALHQEPEQKIIGLAPTHSAVSELESKGVKAQTLESLLSDIRSGSKTSDDYKNSLFFLDESSMVSNTQAKEFTDLILHSQSKAVLLGDKEQLLSLSAGKPFELAMKTGDIKTAYMTDIVRQQNKTLLGAVHNILDKQPASSLDKLSQQNPIDNNQTQHVISTLDESIKDKAIAAEMAKEKLYWSVAKDYLERTPETRNNTLIIAYTNNERDEITEHIRHGLIKKNELGKENVITTRLRSIGASREELATMMPYQKGLVISTKPGEYSTIERVDKENGFVQIKNSETGKESVFLPLHREHKFTALFSVSEKPISSGDKLVTRFTDKTRDIKANVEYTVSSASEQEIKAVSKNGQTLIIDPKQHKDGHWDYAYTRTADMAQGATYQNVITAINAKGMLTNLRRAYIDLTRASQHVRLYTDNSAHLMKSWLSKEVNKHSALETVNQKTPENTVYFNNSPLPHEDIRFQNQSGEFSWSMFKDHLNKELPKYTESLAISILGQPNNSKSSKDYLVFGSGNTGITVSLTGEYRGYFKDYTTGEKGSMLNLIMSHNLLSYKDAMNEANRMINEPEKYQLIENKNHEKLVNTTPKHVAAYEARAKEYLQQSVETKGTLVETYLNNLGIKSIQNENVRFHGNVYSSEDKQLHPAMLVNIHDNKGETRAIEITYLDINGNKSDNLEVNPRILGTKSKHFTDFHSGSDLNTTIISTSIENSFLIQQETQGQFDIISVNHKNDIQNIPTEELRQHIIIILDRENINISPNNVDKIFANFEGKDIQFISDQDICREIKSCIDKFETNSINSHIHDDSLIEANKEHPVEKTHHHQQELNEKYNSELEINDKEIVQTQYSLDLDNETSTSERSNDNYDRDIELELER
ncbi:conjugative transfer relaxase/helicase TraI [Vibrio parahaemolyticus]|nr:conjugative transfer relaxase/helicase TraI [Vibrio parahaemolyticus]